MSDSQSSSSAELGSAVAADESVGRTRRSSDSSQIIASPPSRRWRDVFWLAIFLIHLLGFSLILGVLGLNRFEKPDRLNIGNVGNVPSDGDARFTEDYWPLYAVAGGTGTLLGWTWLLFLGSQANHMMKVSVHILTTYLAVISVLCFWGERFFCGVAFAVGAALQFLYVISVIDRLPFTMLVLQKAVKMVWNLPEVTRIAYLFMLVMLSWMVIWSFGAAGVIASSLDDGKGWWLLVVLSVSLFWTGAVLCNTVHVIVSGLVFLVLIHGGRQSLSMPQNSLLKTLRYAVTTSFGSICYGSLFTAAIRTLRWEIRDYGQRLETMNVYSAVSIFFSTLWRHLFAFSTSTLMYRSQFMVKALTILQEMRGSYFSPLGLNHLLHMIALVLFLLMGTILGGLVAGTCSGVWAWFKYNDKVVMVGSTSMLMGMVLVGVAMAVVESAVTSIYICFAEDPQLIHRWDAEFFNQLSEMLHQRLQHRSARVTEVLTHNRFDGRIQNTFSI